MIHVVRNRDLIIPRWRRPDLTVPMRIEGYVKSVELIHAKTGIILRKLGPFPNLIVDAGLNGLGNGNKVDALVAYLAVGTDNTAPAVSQTALGSQLGTRTNYNGAIGDVVSSGPAYAYWELVRTRVFLEAEANGNLTELGMFQSASAGTMWCRQLFLDDLDAPTTITKTSAEQLRVAYGWRVYVPTSETQNIFDIDSVSTTCQSRALRINDSDSWGTNGYVKHLGGWSTDDRTTHAFETNVFPATTGGTFAGSAVAASSVSIVAYGSGDFYRDMDIVWEPGIANFATGIGAVDLPKVGPFSGGDVSLGTTFTPKVDKDNTERFTFRARVSFART